MPRKGKTVDQNLLEQQMRQYADQTVAPLLNSAFNVTEVSGSGRMAERGDHIIIDGRTARELLVEEFSKTHDPSDGRFSIDFQNFYFREGKTLINQRVASALMTGKQVDVFVPDPKTGRIQKEPSRLTKTGYEPSPLRKPAEMSRWQKFWSKIGFYKDKVAEQENYRRQAAARERVQFYNKATRINSVTLFSEIDAIGDAWGKAYPERKGIDIANLPASDDGRYRLSRQGMPCYVNAVLARKRDENGKPLYTNEQLFDMTDPKMQKARGEAAEEIYQHNLKNDTDWLITLQHDSKTSLKERLDEQGRKLDFSKPDVTDQKGYREYLQLSNTAFEMSQEISETAKELNAKYGPNEHNEISSTLGELPNAVKLINVSLSSQRMLMTGMTGTSDGAVRDAIGDVFGGRTAQQHFANQQKDPTVPPSEYAKGKMMDTISAVRTEAKLEDDDIAGPKPAITQQSEALQKEYQADPRKFARQIASGVLEQRIQLREISVDKEEPATFELRDAATVEREMRQPQKSGGGPTL